MAKDNVTTVERGTITEFVGTACSSLQAVSMKVLEVLRAAITLPSKVSPFWQVFLLDR
jgi:hypothetical protein